MAERTCHNCVYACCDPEAWLRRLCTGEPLVPRCANHPQWPGQLREVPGVPCRNYQPRLPEPEGEVRRILLGDGRYALVDAADYEWLRRYNWSLHSSYVTRHENRRVIYMHREIVQAPEGMIVDHINHDKLDNRSANLRVCTCRENLRNRCKQSGSSSRSKGVGYRRDHKKWYARLTSEDERIWLGYFQNEAQAARAYDRAAVQYFREFAKLNFPEEWPPERRQEIYDRYPPRPAKRATQDTRRKTKKTTAHTETRGRRGSKRKTTEKARRTTKKTTAPKEPKRATKKATTRTETRRPRNGKGKPKSKTGGGPANNRHS